MLLICHVSLQCNYTRTVLQKEKSHGLQIQIFVLHLDLSHKEIDLGVSLQVELKHDTGLQFYEEY